MAPSPESRAPDLSVVVSSYQRSTLLGELLDSLAAQEAERDSFEVIVVDNGSTDDTHAVLAAELERNRLDLRPVRLEQNAGAGGGRNAGWRAARAPLVAFTDDDCVADPGWVSGLLTTARENPGTLIGGRTDARPDQAHNVGPFWRTQVIHAAGPAFQTCNLLFPRAVLEQLEGFDVETYRGVGGEDTDLAWRAIEAGTEVVYADHARVYHVVGRVGPVKRLKIAARWHDGVGLFARHPGLRKEMLLKGVFWKHGHYLLLLALVAAALPSRIGPVRLRWLRFALADPYFQAVLRRGHAEGASIATSLLLAPYFMVFDVVETAAMLRGSVRHRTLVI